MVIQNQQKDLEEVIAYLFNRIEYKYLIEEKKLEFPKMIINAVHQNLNYNPIDHL